MTMVLDAQGRQYGGMNYDHMYSGNMQAPPSFSNPWSHQTSNTAQYPAMSKPEAQRPSLSMPPYTQMPPTSAPLASGSDYSTIGIGGADSLNYSQDISRSSYGEQQFSSPQSASTSYATSYPAPMSYAQSLSQQQANQQRKMSETSDAGRSANPSFGELDASRGMLALSHQNVQDMTPRNIYDVRAQRASTDSYGFPPTTSGNSSISNESGRGYPYYAGSSVGSISSNADSATDYSSASDAGYDITASRTLPRPSQLIGAPLGPPAPQSMMGQFSSKMSANTQKKHKCKVCDKRFTRPSSLQTHMYSHTGEKPFACNVEGCGRHFSVVSNLRRHRKVHKGESASNVSDGED